MRRIAVDADLWTMIIHSPSLQIKTRRNPTENATDKFTLNLPVFAPRHNRKWFITLAPTREFMTSKWLEFQKDLLNLSSSSEHILARKSNHHVQISEPGMVIESIHDLVERRRAKE